MPIIKALRIFDLIKPHKNTKWEQLKTNYEIPRFVGCQWQPIIAEKHILVARTLRFDFRRLSESIIDYFCKIHMKKTACI